MLQPQPNHDLLKSAVLLLPSVSRCAVLITISTSVQTCPSSILQHLALMISLRKSSFYVRITDNYHASTNTPNQPQSTRPGFRLKTRIGHRWTNSRVPKLRRVAESECDRIPASVDDEKLLDGYTEGVDGAFSNGG